MKYATDKKGTLLAGSNSVEYNGIDWITKLVNMPFFNSKKVDLALFIWTMLETCVKVTEMRAMYYV